MSFAPHLACNGSSQLVYEGGGACRRSAALARVGGMSSLPVTGKSRVTVFAGRLQLSFHDLARAPALARAARAEMYERQHTGVIETSDGESVEFAAHAAEVERQHAAWQAVDTDAKQEARVSKVLIKR